MPKTKISEYSATANSNTDVASINIDEGCAPSGINNAIRAVMGHLKDFQSGTSNDPFTVGSSGSLTLSYGTANGVAYLNGSKVLTTNSALVFDGTNLGLGVTPSAWGSNARVLQVAGSGSVFGQTNANIVTFGGNMYWDNTNFKYIATDYASKYVQYQSQHLWFTAPSGTAGNNITFTQAMTLDASGNLLVGTTSDTGRLNVYTSAAETQIKVRADSGQSSTIYFTQATSGYNGYINYSNSSNFLAIATNGSERARIDSSGNLLVGKTALGLAVGTSIDANTSTGSGVRVVSSASTSSADGFQMYSTGAGAYRFYVSFNGTISATTTTISAISDARFKENVRDLDAGLAEVMALKPRLYDWKEGKGADIKNARGFIAQEFEEVFPDLIDEWRDPAPEGEEPYKSVRQDLIPVLVKALQEMKAIIDTQASTITQLQADVAALKGA